MSLIVTASTVVKWVIERMVVQNVNRGLEATKADKVIAWLLKRKAPEKTKPKLILTLDTYSFLNATPINSGIYKLFFHVRAQETLTLERITVLFNRAGGNGSYTLGVFTPLRHMHAGEDMIISLMHYRVGVGAFWGDVSEVTERRILDRLSQEQVQDHIRRVLLTDGAYYCQIVVLHSNGEERLNFTLFNPHSYEKPAVFTSNDLKDYEPNRHLPGRRGYGQ